MSNINWLVLVISMLFGYLIGSISFANIIVKKLKGIDIKTVGSGNAGTTNVLRAAGFFPALLTFLLDFAKGSVAVLFPMLIAKLFKEDALGLYMIVGGIFSIIGHTLPVFFKFKGGKGMATYLGVILAMNPIAFFINISFMLVIILITRMVSVASLTSAVLTPILIIFLKDKTILPDQNIYFVLGAALVSLIVIFKHRENIKRLKEGRENKIDFKKA